MDFFHLLPGASGGLALLKQKGAQYYATVAREAAARRSEEERRLIALKAAQERRRRRLHIPKTVVTETSGIRVVERVIPYWKEAKGRRQPSRPEFVRVELECIKLPQVPSLPRYFVLEEGNRYSI